MRFRSLVLLVSLIFVSASNLFFTGCSGTDKVVPTNNVIDYNEVWLPNAISQVNEQLDSVIGRIDAGLSAVTVLDNGLNDLFSGSLPIDSSTYQSGWNVIYITNLQTSLGMITVLDSVQYSKNNIPQQFNGNADAILFNHNYNRTASDTTITSNSITLRGTFSAETLDQSRTTIDGFLNSVIVDKTVTTDSTVWHIWSIQTSAIALRVGKVGNGWGEGCPSSGTINQNVSHLYKKDNSSLIQTNWQFAIMFNNGVATINVSNDLGIANTYQQTICNP